MTASILFFIATAIVAAYLSGKPWLRAGNPDREVLRRRWNHSTRKEVWGLIEREQQFELWLQLHAPDDRPLSVRFFDGLDLVVAVFCFVAATQTVGMYDGAPTYDGNGTELGNNLIAFAIWGLKFVVLMVAILVGVYRLLGSIEQRAVKVLGQVLFLILAGFVWSLSHRDTHAEPAAAPAATVAPTEQSRPDSPETRNLLIARLRSLDAQAQARWRADIAAAGASGPAGQVPPMLELKEAKPGQWLVKNLSDKTVCVRISRVAPPAKGEHRFERCPGDEAPVCREITRRGERRFTFARGDRQRACIGGLLEFRVGTVQNPEPSWWSDSALEYFAAEDAIAAGYADYDVLRLRGEIAMFESMLAEKDRAVRWRRELAAETHR